jgi:hypothetical protein
MEAIIDMSKSKSIDIFRHDVKSVNRWDQAIADAENMIVQAESKIKQMRRAIKAFQVMRDSGEPWPGTVEAGMGEPKTENPRRLQAS